MDLFGLIVSTLLIRNKQQDDDTQDALIIVNNYGFSTATMVMRTPLSVRLTYIDCHVRWRSRLECPYWCLDADKKHDTQLVTVELIVAHSDWEPIRAWKRNETGLTSTDVTRISRRCLTRGGVVISVTEVVYCWNHLIPAVACRQPKFNRLHVVKQEIIICNRSVLLNETLCCQIKAIITPPFIIKFYSLF
jgi:hypothetical protein